MIKDFVPARTSLASGVVIKQTLLERNKYPQPQVSQETVTYTGSIESTQLWDPITQQKYISHSLIETFDGGAGGVFNTFNEVTNVSQSWYETIPTVSGSVIVLHNSQDEFYDGEFSGSTLIVTTQSLAQAYPLENLSFNYTPVIYSNTSYGLSNFNQPFTQNQFLNPLTTPSTGQILILIPYDTNKSFLGPIIKSPSYVKIHKLDNNNNDNTIPLSQITNLVIKYTSNIWDNISIINIF
jgi:hypothetical protein